MTVNYFCFQLRIWRSPIKSSCTGVPIKRQQFSIPRRQDQELVNNWRGYQDQDIKRNDESKAKPGPEVAVIGLSLAPQPVRAGALRDCTSTHCRIASTPQAHTARWQAHLKNPAAKKTRTTTPPTDLASKIKNTTRFHCRHLVQILSMGQFCVVLHILTGSEHL